ncbi:MAG: hypothetical protein KC657_10975 [Myxococcales bacterium]|nr:hypothetical protein [Myxococcales bacterium]
MGMGWRAGIARLLCCGALIGLAVLPAACSSSNQDGARSLGGGDPAAQVEHTERARGVLRGMMGLPATASKPSASTTDAARTRRARYEAVADHIIDAVEKQQPGALAQFSLDLQSEDRARALRAYPEMRQKLRTVAASQALKESVRGDAAFGGVRIQGATAGGVRILEMADDGVLILGRGPDGKFGDGREGWTGALTDELDGFTDVFTPWRTLGRIDRGELEVDPESRLGAYAATRGYPPGSVGEAVHNAIGTIYIVFNDYGQERIGRVFNSPEARALYGFPVESSAGAQMAAIEQRYWQNVLLEDSWSPGGKLGSMFSPVTRDWLQQNVFSSGGLPLPAEDPGGGGGVVGGDPANGGNGGNGGNGPTGGNGVAGDADGDGKPDEPLSKTDCGDKADGWWCFEAGTAVGWMVYCKDKQILSGCGCGACGAGTGGTAASCNAAPPPAACP